MTRSLKARFHFGKVRLNTPDPENYQTTGAVMTKKRVADLLVDTLVASGVQRVYGLAGDSLE